MGQVIVRNLDDAVLESLRARARERGKSMEQFLREGITAMAAPDRRAWLDELDQIRSMAPVGSEERKFPLAEDLIREDRDRQ